jgi:hypothetical protein
MRSAWSSAAMVGFNIRGSKFVRARRRKRVVAFAFGESGNPSLMDNAAR